MKSKDYPNYLSELLKANSYSQNRANLYYYKTTVKKDDFKHIYKLKDEINKEFDKGIVLYMGNTFLKIDENMYAVPIGFLK